MLGRGREPVRQTNSTLNRDSAHPKAQYANKCSYIFIVPCYHGDDKFQRYFIM